MSGTRRPNTKQKAFGINLDLGIYGSFAEIGAGQEVVRHFFRAGGAAGTVAKTMSAYDMKFSDDIYGKEGTGGRYVSESRILRMLDHEYSLLEERLGGRGTSTRFFAFADTVAAKSYTRKGENHGWMGLRFQHAPMAPTSEVVVHVRMLDRANIQQQEALGLVGVNLIYACFHYTGDRESFVGSLMDDLADDRIEIDMIRIGGSAFEDCDSRLFSLELVKRGFCKAIMFDSSGGVHQVGDVIYKKHVVLCRGSYRPPTHLNLDMLEKGMRSFVEDIPEKDDIVVLPEISMSKLVERDGQLDNRDFLARVELLNALGHNVLISNHKYYWELSWFVSSHSKKVAFVMGVYNLEEFFYEVKNHESETGLLGALGKLTGRGTKLYIYPARDEMDGKLLRYGDAQLDSSYKNLIAYLDEVGGIKDIEGIDQKFFCIWSRNVLERIVGGEDGWEECVPGIVERAIKERRLFGT